MSERAAKMEIYEQFMHDLDGSGQRLTDSVSEVDVADPEDVKALITSGSSDMLVHFGQEKFLQRYQQFEEHLQEWKQQYPKLASADMRYDGQIVLEMQGDGKAAAGWDGRGGDSQRGESCAGGAEAGGEREAGCEREACCGEAACRECCCGEAVCAKAACVEAGCADGGCGECCGGEVSGGEA